MGGFARISNNEITILGNGAEISTDIDPQEAQQTLEIDEANLSRAEGKRQAVEANLALRLARTRVEAVKGGRSIQQYRMPLYNFLKDFQ
ncbi:ATP synthase epsilon chain, chloroplastic [Dendrobium catenatum]|uniref:ATP synthase epsilon chain, chloroplastic n=1 Tax=Dendrobium catenatum TaxID=906689 RepID=A0A2I0VIH3_9ASPA|nr:ATP synthase epsilon chain, chloroplastic [Dendrobium catenatum]